MSTDLMKVGRLIVLAIVLTGCASTTERRATSETPVAQASSANEGAVQLAELRSRPLDVPSLTAEDACPVTELSSSPSVDLGTMWGDERVRPVLGATSRIGLAPPANYGSDVWGGAKVLWAMSAEGSSIALIRGHQLDGDAEVRFDEGDTPAEEKVLDPGGRQALEGGWYDFPGSVRLRNPGCYGFQIDIGDDSFVIVLEAA
jgi:hypothetical protein